MNVLTAAASLACASPPNQIREELLRYRRVRTTGVGLGAGLVTTSFALGIADGAISPVAACTGEREPNPPKEVHATASRRP